jgi:hypothetical protein
LTRASAASSAFLTVLSSGILAPCRGGVDTVGYAAMLLARSASVRMDAYLIATLACSGGSDEAGGNGTGARGSCPLEDPIHGQSTQ